MEISIITIVHAGIFMADICFFIYLYKSYCNLQDLNDVIQEQAQSLKVGAEKFYEQLGEFHKKIINSAIVPEETKPKKEKKDK